MNECWAKILGNCDNKISGEHIVSRSFFESTMINVQGFSWCKHEIKTIGISSLTKKCLCKKHNSLLSELDSAASHAASVMKDQNKLSHERSNNTNKNYKRKTYSINATLLERWLLKTLINFSYGSEYIIGCTGIETGRPSEDLVHIVYGHKEFMRLNGLCVVSKNDLRLRFSERLDFCPLIKDSKYIVGGRFNFWGIQLFLDITQNGMDVPFEAIPNMDVDWHNIILQRKFKHFRHKVGKRTSIEVKFNWPK